MEVNKSLPGNSDQSQPAEPVANGRVAALCLVVSLFPLLTRLKQHASPQRSAPLALSTQATIPISPPSLPFQLFYIFALWRQGIGAVQWHSGAVQWHPTVGGLGPL